MARVVVIGGGISGLAAAHRLTELARARDVPCAITLLEARERLGGVIETRTQDGVLLESGPDAFITEKPWAVELCHRLGLAEELIETQPASRRSFIVHHGRLIAVPEGWYLIAPARLAAIFRSPLLSWAGKLRMACEPLIPPRRVAPGRDESLGRFITRRFGREALARIGQPMIAGIYTADPDRLSLEATMPKLAEMERRHGSVIKALRAVAREPTDPTASASGPRYSLFVSLRGGMQRFVHALLGAMPEVSVRRGAAVQRIAPGPPWTVRLQDGSQLEAEGLCLALPAPQAAALLEPFAPDLAEALAHILYESVATVNMAFRASEVPPPIEGFGFVVPAIERRRIVGCTFASMKFAGRAPERSVLVRAFVGGALHREQFALNDQAMTAMVREELADLLGIRAAPFIASVHRHPDAMPQYEVGHLERIDAIEAKTARYPGLALTGNGYRGLGIPDCIHQAQDAAARLMAWVA